jgi:hypothetical protein
MSWRWDKDDRSLFNRLTYEYMRDIDDSIGEYNGMNYDLAVAYIELLYHEIVSVCNWLHRGAYKKKCHFFKY